LLALRPLSVTVHRTKAWKTIGSMGKADERQRVSRRAGPLARAGLPAKADDTQRSRLGAGRTASSRAAGGVAARQIVRLALGSQAVAGGWIVQDEARWLREGGSPLGQVQAALNIAVQRSSGSRCSPCGR